MMTRTFYVDLTIKGINVMTEQFLIDDSEALSSESQVSTLGLRYHKHEEHK